MRRKGGDHGEREGVAVGIKVVRDTAHFLPF